MAILDRITINPAQCGGKPCIRGMRIRVADVLDMLAAGMSETEILADHPDLARDDITASLAFAAKATLLGAAVHVLQHVRTDSQHGEDVKLIGVYRSDAEARDAVERLKTLPGFRDCADGFQVDRYELDKDHWVEGFGIDE